MAGSSPSPGTVAIFWGVFQTLILVAQLVQGVEINCECNDEDEQKTEAAPAS
ncbi:MAG: hypothetical protein AMXMBFR84_06370 [Candidatus Hydrogenedentota bacterium]